MNMPLPCFWSAYEPDLIFDLGLHRGLDTRFYLDKGFRVIALDANPRFANDARSAFAKEVAEHRLTIIDSALWSSANAQIPFFINPEADDWSSAFKGWAEKGGHTSHEITVPTITLDELFDKYGVPYYIKCDIEGADGIFAQQLLLDRRRPPFVSVEACSLDILALLYASGYDRIQIVNQWMNAVTKAPNPPLEGVYVEPTFNGHTSGLFGKELDQGKWLNFRAAAERFLDFERLRNQDNSLAIGWLDFHVTSTSLAMR